MKESGGQRYKRDPEYRAAQASYSAKRYATDPAYRARMRASARANYLKNHERSLVYAAKQRARKLGLPFSITPADVVIPEKCPVLGTPLVRGKRGASENAPSIDRFIPELGYVPENIRVISTRANALKSNATAAELRAVLAYVERNRA